MFKSHIKKTVGEEKGNNHPDLDGCGDAEEKKNNKCGTDSYFPHESDDSNDHGDCEKKQNEIRGKKTL